MYTLQNNTPLSNTGVNAGEVVRYVRNALSGTSKGANDPGIKNRSIDGFLKDANEWKRTLERRTEQKSCGFFARPDYKYKECGNVVLKNKKLVISSLKEIGNSFHTQHENRSNARQEENKDTTQANQQQQKSSHLSIARSNKNERDIDNGFSLIKERLRRAEKRITFIKAGQKLADQLVKENAEKELERQQGRDWNDDMVMIDPSCKKNSIPVTNLTTDDEKQSGDGQTDNQTETRSYRYFAEKLENIVTIFKIVQNMRPRDLKTKTPLSLDALKSLKNSNFYENRRTGRLSILSQRHESLSHGTTPKTRDAGTKIPHASNLHESTSRHSEIGSPNLATPRIRNTATNSKQNRRLSPVSFSRHVENVDDFITVEPATPLTAADQQLEVNNNWMKVAPSRHGGMNANVSRQQMSHKRQRQPSLWHVARARHSSKTLPPISLDATPSRMNASNSPNPMTSSRRKITIYNKHNKNQSPVMSQQQSYRVPETWDEFVSMETGTTTTGTGGQAAANANKNETTENQLDVNNNFVRGPSRVGIHSNTSKQQMSFKRQRVHTWNTKQTTENIPLWQKIIQQSHQRDINEKDIQNANAKKQGKSSSEKHEELLSSLVNGFEKTKKKYADKVEKELINRADAYQVQYDAIAATHLKEQDLKRMRTRVQEWRQLINAESARPPTWMELLKMEQKELGIKKNDAGMGAKFQQLRKYVDTQGSAVLKAKLCLLVLSLPAYEICKVPMQDAAKFFAKHIVDTSENNINEWLVSRKLLTNNNKNENNDNVENCNK
ncbi:uncharacterized protein [Clytia hemisphaerica]|uniref:Uncharacterized protein n=1 Tax=Clytia hemisphaerica TaxID=252671 RepID=A0A7M5XE12_9CNID